MKKYKVTTITTHYNRSTYVIDAENEKEAVIKLVNRKHGVELIDQETIGEPEFPKTHDAFIVKEF